MARDVEPHNNDVQPRKQSGGLRLWHGVVVVALGVLGVVVAFWVLGTIVGLVWGVVKVVVVIAVVAALLWALVGRRRK